MVWIMILERGYGYCTVNIKVPSLFLLLRVIAGALRTDPFHGFQLFGLMEEGLQSITQSNQQSMDKNFTRSAV